MECFKKESHKERMKIIKDDIRDTKKRIRQNRVNHIELWQLNRSDGEVFLEIYNSTTGEYESFKRTDKGKDENPKSTDMVYGMNGYKRKRMVEDSLQLIEDDL
jgi:hypothetical protein